ncbi:MAG: hypothetical protein PHU00_08340 [Bacteroidales bacterium]|nr:hypothetical protein [Bacteroidales bacterium]
MDPVSTPFVLLNPNTGAIKTFPVAAICVGGKLTRIRIEEQSHPTFKTDTSFALVDNRYPITLDADGYMNRQVSNIVLQYSVTLPKDFKNQVYSAKVIFTNDKGEEKSTIISCRTINFYYSTSAIQLHYGKWTKGARTYTSNASLLCIRYSTTLLKDEEGKNILDENGKTITVRTGVSPNSLSYTYSTNTTYGPNTYGFMFTDLWDNKGGTMYLYSPDQAWIQDSLSTLNNYKLYDISKMNSVRYVELGIIDFVQLKDSDFQNIDFENKGVDKVELKPGYSYAFMLTTGEVAIIFVKKITRHATNASPNAYCVIAVEAEPDSAI